MPELNFTPAQRCAIESRGSTLLVSAAAGSGKTRVLTERLMAYLTDPQQPQELDRFLIITYTRAAAAELRARIAGSIAERMAADPENRWLRRQSALCARAQIGTIHSFCSAVLRENCAALRLAPDFKIADAERVQSLQAAALEKTLDRAYETIEQHPDFRLLADTVGAGRSDARLGALIGTLYEKMQCHARPARWAEAQIERLQLTGVTDAGETVWGTELLSAARETALYWAGELDRLLAELALPDCAWLSSAYGESIAESADGVRAVARAALRGWDETRTALLEVTFPRLKTVRKPPDEALKNRVKARRDTCKKAVEELRAQYAEPSSKMLADLRETAPAMQALLRLTLDFGRAYAAEKRRRALVDFSDLEHFTAELLTQEDGAPTPLARELSARYTEIMVDEYQDVSEVQDLIFHAVSQNGNNLFFVGDVKQSIYRFRLADPGIFLDKYSRFADARDAQPGEARRILLQENFRSRREVLDAANLAFSNIMSTSLGELDYDDNARLKCGAPLPGEGTPAELCLLQLPEDDGGELAEKAEREADYVARRIRALVDGETPVLDGGGMRPAAWGDIVILLRSANAVGPVYRRALTAHGVPVLSEQGGGFYASVEISVLLSLLAVIDNPHQDVPLIAVLRSPLFGFTPDDLSAVRAVDRTHDFYDALTAAAETRADCRAFLNTLEGYRALAPDLEPGALLWHIYNDRNLMALCCALPDGDARRRNLMLLLDQAQQFGQTGAHGLHRFVEWLRHQAEEGREPPVSGGGRSAVRIMSIHKSKGLEFPIVFVSDLSRAFNKSDARATVLVHPQLGLGPKRTDAARGIEYPTFARSAVAARLLRETLSEEMRLLYVAMTRAKERLILTGTLRDPARTIDALRESLSAPLAPEVLRRAPSPLHWLLQSALLDPEGQTLRVETVSCAAAAAPDGAQPDETSVPGMETNPEALRQLSENLTFVYPHAAAAALPSKITATELKRPPLPEDGGGAPLLRARQGVFRRPDFTARERPLTGAERGTATHRFLQYLRFADTADEAAVARQVAALQARGFLSVRQAAAVDVSAVLALARSPLGARLRAAEAAGTMRREFRFSLLCGAAPLDPAAADEQVLLQGVVDCCIEEAGALTIVDYKTDRVPPDAVPERAAYYAAQLRAYAAAMARITGRPAAQRLLYFLHCGVTAEVPADDEKSSENACISGQPVLEFTLRLVTMAKLCSRQP